MGIAVETFLFCGLSVRDDAIERQNIAASCGISGALIGVTLCFAGGNIGLLSIRQCYLQVHGFFMAGSRIFHADF